MRYNKAYDLKEILKQTIMIGTCKDEHSLAHDYLVKQEASYWLENYNPFTDELE